MTDNTKSEIYDCFMFFNELDLLEIRLNELNDVVDYFVLVEAPFTHSGKTKPLYYEINKTRYKKWSKKIIHVICPWPKKGILEKFFEYIEIKFPYKFISRIYIKFSLGRKKIEAFQRNYTLNGLKNAKAEDILLLSDVDEIPKKDKVLEIKKILSKNPTKTIRLDQKLFGYYINGEVNQEWQSAKACLMKTLTNDIKKPDFLRNWKIRYRLLSIFHYRPIIKREILLKNAGWHFSYLGGVQAVKEKIASISHFENDTAKDNNDAVIEEKIKKGEFFYQNNKNSTMKYIPLDNTFPEEITKNNKKYSKLIKSVD